MANYINRQVYLQKLINRRDNGEVKIIIVGDDIATCMDDNGYIFMSLFQFLKNDDVLE